METVIVKPHVDDYIDPTRATNVNGEKIPLGLYPVVAEYNDALTAGYEKMINFVPSIEATTKTIETIKTLAQELNENKLNPNLKKLPPDVYEIIQEYEILFNGSLPAPGSMAEKEYTEAQETFKYDLGKKVAKFFYLPHVTDERNVTERVHNIDRMVSLLPIKWEQLKQKKAKTAEKLPASIATVATLAVVSPMSVLMFLFPENIFSLGLGTLVFGSAYYVVIRGSLALQKPAKGKTKDRKFMKNMLTIFEQDYESFVSPAKQRLVSYLIQESPILEVSLGQGEQDGL